MHYYGYTYTLNTVSIINLITHFEFDSDLDSDQRIYKKYKMGMVNIQ